MLCLWLLTIYYNFQQKLSWDFRGQIVYDSRKITNVSNFDNDTFKANHANKKILRFRDKSTIKTYCRQDFRSRAQIWKNTCSKLQSSKSKKRLNKKRISWNSIRLFVKIFVSQIWHVYKNDHANKKVFRYIVKSKSIFLQIKWTKRLS